MAIMTVEPRGNVVLPSLHGGGQLQVFNDPKRFKIMVCGRRWGKSLLAAVWLISIALRGGVGWWVWPSFPVAMIGWRRLIKILAPLIAAKAVTVNKQERLIEFPGGGSIQMKSADRPDSLRGEGLDGVVIDEWAYIRNGLVVWESDLRPALAEKMGQALLITTPRGMNFVFEYYYKMKGNEEYGVYHFPTWNNPFIPKAEIASAKASLGKKVFDQEYGALFVEDAYIFFGDMVRIMKAEWQRKAIPGHDYRAGLDIGRYRDNSVFSVVDISLKPNEICFVEQYTDMSFTMQKNRVLTTSARFDIDILMMDVTGMGIGLGERIDEAADFTCLPMVYSNKTKMDMFENLHGAYENDELLIPDLEWLKVEHQMMRPQIVPGRLTVKLDARSGFKDDGPNSCALANKARKEPRVSLW